MRSLAQTIDTKVHQFTVGINIKFSTDIRFEFSIGVSDGIFHIVRHLISLREMVGLFGIVPTFKGILK